MSERRPRRRLIVNADDLGLAAEENAGIVRAVRDGIVRSTSLLVTGEAAAEGVAMVRATGVAVGIGLHLCLTELHPASTPADVASLVGPDGRLRAGVAWLEAPDRARPELARDVAPDVARELEAQLELFEALVGAPPDHLDVHQLLDVVSPTVRRAVHELAARRSLPVRDTSFATHAPSLGAFLARIDRQLGGGSVASRIDARILAARLAGASTGPVRSPDRLELSLSDPATPPTPERAVELIRRLPPGVTELLCHPGEGSPRRRAERRAVGDPAVARAVREEDVELVTFGAVPPEPRSSEARAR